MDNKEIIKQLRTLISMMELHGENDYKIKSYNAAIFNLERFDKPIEDMSIKELEQIKGVGKSIGSIIDEINKKGKPDQLEELLSKTPPGIIELLDIKGIGAKKIRILWQDLNIESIPQLLDAINQDKLAEIKGFGKKTQENIKKAITYKEANRGKLYFADAEEIANGIVEMIKNKFKDTRISITGEVRRKLEVIEKLSFVCIPENINQINEFLNNERIFDTEDEKESPFTWYGIYKETHTPVEIYFCDPDSFYSMLIITTGSPLHLSSSIEENVRLRSKFAQKKFNSEEEAYRSVNLAFIEPELREGQFEISLARDNNLPELIEPDDLKGILHCHSTYSDGKNTLKEMADYCKELGYQYLGIADHSKSAYYYANGMYEEKVKEQQEEIDLLNKELSPFKIFKGIESDILPDGELDYEPATLRTFDFVVASIHSALSMDINKATERLINAVSNPFTTILGHPTGRLLLIRDGYPIDHKAVIDASAKNGVIIEINSHPNRLDLDWRWVKYAMDQGVMLSINPDAHEKAGYHHMYYGICVGRKGGLTKEMTFNAKSVDEVEAFFKKRKEKYQVGT